MKIHSPNRTAQLGASPYHLLLRALGLLLLCYYLLVPKVALVQNETELPSYWQHSSSGRLHSSQPADLNRDGVQEFLIVDENNRIEPA